MSRGTAIALEPGADGYSFAVGDVDADGHQDVVSGFDAGSISRIAVMRGDGKGQFRATDPVTVQPVARVATLAEVHGDRRLDIVMTHGRSRSVEVLINLGNGSFRPAPSSPYTAGGEANAALIADVNRDNRQDLVAATVESVTVFTGGNNGFTPATGSPFSTGPGTYNIALGDINEDGRLDLAASSFEGDAVTLLLGQ